MTPSEKTMPTVEARYEENSRRWLVALPGGVELPARDETEVVWIVSRHAPGSSIRFMDRTQPTARAGSPA